MPKQNKYHPTEREARAAFLTAHAARKAAQERDEDWPTLRLFALQEGRAWDQYIAAFKRNRRVALQCGAVQLPVRPL